MNILQMEDMVKGLPDQVLMQEAQMPSGQIPQFLALSEVQRRKEMRDKFQAPPQATVADQILQSGIASAMPQQPPQGGMAPPQGAPMGPPPVAAYGGGMMPYTMADGGAVPSGLQELNDAMVSARYRRGQGFLESVAPNPMNSFQAAKDLPSRLQALQRMADTGPSPYEPGNYGYTQSESGFGNDPFRMGPSGFIQAGHQAEALDRAGAMALGNRYQDYLNRMTNPFAGTGSGIVRDERLGDQSLNLDDYGMGMYGGGQVPYRMQEGRTVPNESAAQRRIRLQAELNRAIQEGAPRSVIEDLRRELDVGFSLRSPGEMSAGAMNQRIGQMGLNPTMEAPAINLQAPDFSAQLNAAMQAPPVAADVAVPGMTPPAGGATPVAPRQDAASMISEIAGALPDATRALSGMNAGIPDATRLLRGAEPVQADYEALRPDFSPFIQQVEQRGKESVQRYEQSIKDIENRMKQERLGAVLTTLGANLMAGEGALGLEKAGLTAQQIGKEMRQEVAAERRALDAAREGTADKVLTLQLQQVTADTGAKRDFLKANDEFRKLGVQVAIDQGKEARAAQRDMNQLALNLASNTISRLKSLDEQNALNTRSFVTAMSAESDTILKLLEQMVITDPNEKIKKYNQLMESKIRGYGALYPNIDISSVIAAFKQDTGGTGGTGAQSSTAGGNWGEMRVR